MSGIGRALREARAALGAVAANPGLRRLQVAWGSSVFGQWFYNVALGVFAFQADGASGVALVALVRFGLSGVLAPFTSLLGDRLPRRALMIGSDLLRAAAMAGMALAATVDAPAVVVYALAVVVTVASTAFHPAEAAMLPGLARTPEELTAANVVSGTLANVAGLAGPALGGLLFAAAGAEVVFAVTAVTFLASASVLVGVAEPDRSLAEPDGSGAGEPAGVMRAALAGFVAVRRDGRLRVIIGLYAASALTWGALSVIVVVLALEDLDMGEQGVGYLLGAISLGGLIGGAGAALLAGGRHLARALGVSTLVWGLPLVLIAALIEPWMALVALAILGVGESLIEVTTLTLLQRAVPDEVRARVFGVLESVTVGALAIGAAVAAPLLSGLGTRGALLVTGLLLPGLALAVLPRLAAIDRETSVPTTELELLGGVPLFAPLPSPVLEGLAGRLRVVHVAAGEEVVRQGEPGDIFYIVEEGTLGVARDGAPLRDLGPGDFFGEIALLRAIPRTATVTAACATTLRALRGDEFVAAVTGHAESAEAADAVVDTRLTFRGPQGVA
ncbi:MFS transporter [Miltoncostaea oceani]|uniref:MFS transporter n=1 Tax=Miltoncostaea oceani TaxID=2843216 RepID=UPI001C3D9D5D|nr:MFS transporter [Miltoncostaea oceani]